MFAQDALLGWDERANAELYAAFTRRFPMYGATSRHLVERTSLTDSRLVADLCGGTGVTAEAVLEVAPPDTRVISLDSSTAMQQVGQESIRDPRITWVTAKAEEVSQVIRRSVDAVVCNSAIWKTNTPATFNAVRRVLRPSGRFGFNIGGGFAGVTHPDEEARPGPSLTALIRDVAARDYGYTPPQSGLGPPKLPLDLIERQLRTAGFTVVESDVVAHHSTMEEKRAWLSVPLFARPEGAFTHQQRMDILEKAYAQVDPHQPTVTSWLVVVAEAIPRDD